ncbi:MAG: tRNA pseudouridine(38-40) synthase TruA, partial [Haloarculaceae archaeon]
AAPRRTYTYSLHAPDASDERARYALDVRAGEHDFHNLTPDEDGTVRTLSPALDREGPFLVVELTAGGFARQLVRRTISVVAEVARRDAPLARIEQVLAPQPLDGAEGVAPAPAVGLVLTEVTYPTLEFAVDETAAASARTVFERRRVDHATRSRVAGALTDRRE